MTRKQPKRATPKPVEAWALCDQRGIVTNCTTGLPVLVESEREFLRFQNNPAEYVVRVRIVPITKKPRRAKK